MPRKSRELGEEREQLIDDLGVCRRKIVQAAQIGRGALRIAELVAADAGAAREQLAHERPVEHLFERAPDHGFGALEVAHLCGEDLELLEPLVADVRDDRVANPHERLLAIAEIVERDPRRSTEHGAARAAAVARALPSGGERLGEHAPQAFVARSTSDAARAPLRGARWLPRRAGTEHDVEEAASALVVALRGRDARCTRERDELVRGVLAARDLALVDLDDEASSVVSCASRSSSGSTSAGGTLVSACSPC